MATVLFVLGDGTPMVAIEAARDCCPALGAGLRLGPAVATPAEVPNETLLFTSCLSLELAIPIEGVAGGVGGLITGAPSEVARTKFGRGTVGGRIVPLAVIRDLGIALLTSTWKRIE